MKKSIRLFLQVFGLCLLASTFQSQGEAKEYSNSDYAENYTRHHIRIPMRDGVELFTVIHTPKTSESSLPILLVRTPYGLKPYTLDTAAKPGAFTDAMWTEKFIFVQQDVRGRYGSGGEFLHVRPHQDVKSAPTDTDESTDAWDTIDWLVKHVPGNNGRVGMTGISYPGFYAAAGMIDSHPALKAVSPQAPVAALLNGDDTLHGGTLWLCHNWGFMGSFEQKLDEPTRQDSRPFDYHTPDGYRFFLEGGSLAELGARHFKGRIAFWDELMTKASDASWCEARDISRHLRHVTAAVMTVGGWFDAEDLSGALRTFRATGEFNTNAVNTLVMGPWSHGQWHRGDGEALGPIHFHSSTADYFRDQIELPFFNHFLKDKHPETHFPKAWVFETGRDFWRKETQWPPAGTQARELFFHAHGLLSLAPPTDGESAYDEYVSDPNRPVPFTQRISTGMPREYMLEDQRFASTRPDVLTYQTEPLTEDITLAGPVTARLNVSTTGTDSDWVVKLIDVYTDGYPNPEPNPSGLQMGHYQQLVRGEPQRGKYREGYARPLPFEPGKVTPVEWVMPDICHTFRAGHRIMVQVQSSWFPLMDRNPQTFCDIYHARPEDFRKATQRIYRSTRSPSSVRVLVDSKSF